MTSVTVTLTTDGASWDLPGAKRAPIMFAEEGVAPGCSRPLDHGPMAPGHLQNYGGFGLFHPDNHRRCIWLTKFRAEKPFRVAEAD